MEVEFFDVVYFLSSENYLGAKKSSYDIEKNGYGTCCIIGGHLRFFFETTCNMEVRGYYCFVH